MKYIKSFFVLLSLCFMNQAFADLKTEETTLRKIAQDQGFENTMAITKLYFYQSNGVGFDIDDFRNSFLYYLSHYWKLQSVIENYGIYRVTYFDGVTRQIAIEGPDDLDFHENDLPQGLYTLTGTKQYGTSTGHILQLFTFKHHTLYRNVAESKDSESTSNEASNAVDDFNNKVSDLMKVLNN